MTLEEAKNRARGYSTDMSPAAISRRLEMVNELNRVCAWLGNAKTLGLVEQGAPPTLTAAEQPPPAPAPEPPTDRS